MAAALTYQSTQTRSSTSNTATYNTIGIGTASSDRYVILGLLGEPSAAGNEEWSSVTIGGVAATKIVSGFETSTGISAAIYMLLVTSGTTCDIVATSTGNHLNNVCHVWTATGIESTASATNSNSSDPLNMNTNVPLGGVAFGCGQFASTTAITTTGFTENYDTSFDGDRFIGGSYGPAGSAESPRTFTFDGGTGNAFGVVAVFAAAATEIIGTLNSTLGAATLSGAGAVAIDGALSSTLGAATLSGAGAVAVDGTLSSTLGVVTLSGAGAVVVDGDLDATLGAATLEGAGAVVVDGDLDATLDAVTLSGVGAVATTGALDATLGAVALSGAGAVAVDATLNATLDAVTLEGVGGGDIITGALSATLDAVALSATGTVEITGSLNATLGDVSLSATGEVESAIEPPVVVPPVSGSGGGGGYYRRRYRGDIKNAIRRAVADLHGRRTLRSRKRASRRIATKLVEELRLDFPPLPTFTPTVEVVSLEPIRQQLLQLSISLNRADAASAEKARQMQQLLSEYEAAVAKIEREEEEAAIALVLAIAA